MQGMSFGPADFAAARRMKTTASAADTPATSSSRPAGPGEPRGGPRLPQQDLWHYSIARMVDACTSAGILPFTDPSATSKTSLVT